MNRPRNLQPPPRRTVLLFALLPAAFLFLACSPRSREHPSANAPAQPPAGSAATQTAPAEPSTDQPGKPRTDDYADRRHAMVARQIEARGVRDPAVLQAMRAVPRHWFVPERLRSLAYADSALPIGEDQTISQPYIVALMTESLNLTPQSKVLEIGTGSGYQAAVLAEITPHVFTIEIVQPLARRAIDTFKRHRYDTINVRIGDGYAGWPDHAPFDAIIVTCAPDHVPPALVQQLKPGGRICIPVGPDGGPQELHILTKSQDGELHRQNLIPVRFVPMTGRAQDHPPADDKER